MRSFFGRLVIVARMSLEADFSLSVRTLAVAVVYFLSGSVIGAVLLKVATNAVVGRHWLAVLGAGMGLACFQGFSFAISRLHGRLYPVLQERNREHYDRRILELTAGIPGIEHYENPEYLNRLEDLRNRPQVLAQMLAVTVQASSLVVQTLVVVIILATIDPWLMVVPVFALPALWTMRRAEALEESAWTDVAEPTRLTQSLYRLLTGAEAAKELRMQRLEDELIARHDQAWATIDRRRRAAELRASGLTVAGWITFAVAYGGMVIVTVQQAARGRASVGDVVLTVTLATQLNRQVVTVLEVVGRLIRNSRGIDRYLWLVDYAVANDRPEGKNPPPSALSLGIEVNDVGFAYPNGPAEVLSGLRLSLPAGKVVAIVGENGAGKTTLIKLLTGMYRPSTGSITVDGTDLEAMDLTAWRRQSSAAFQDFARFELSLGESVGVGDTDRIDSEEAILAAMERAGAGGLVDELPSGLATPLGGAAAGGSDLSGGQWQKVALSRAMMRPLPLLLVLDEPTASLDPLAERSLFDRYSDWAREAGRRSGTVTILVSHRFSTVQAADLIVVMEAGRVTETGSHQDLVGRGGLYAELFELQARQYA